MFLVILKEPNNRITYYANVSRCQLYEKGMIITGFEYDGSLYRLLVELNSDYKIEMEVQDA